MFKVAAVLAFLAVASANLHDRAYYEEKFFEWLQEHKFQPQSGSHFVKVLQNFANNADIIETHNAGNATYTLGHNQFSHMSLDEFRAYVRAGGIQREAREPSTLIHEAPTDVSNLAATIDWRTKGAVGDVKDQGQCGSCWAFSTVGAVEGAYAIKKGHLNTYAEQHLVDCDNRQNSANKGSDMGCNGGLMDSAFSWLSKNKGLCSQASYPYTSGSTKTSGTCKDTTCGKDASVAFAKTPYTDVKVNSDSAMMSALNLQPVAIAIEADQSAFQLYKSGVFTATCGASLDHGVLAVGYGHDDSSNLDYYIVRNSWGTTWGDKGYILLQKGGGQNNGKGQCGMLAGPPSYPNLA